MFAIEPTDLHWLEGTDPQQDICAHGGFVIRSAGSVIVDESKSEWTLSAAALYLLRTLEKGHTTANPIADHLFPCCGHAMFPDKDSSNVVIIGCPNGYDFGVRHSGNDMILSFHDGDEVKIPCSEWRRAVVDFSDAISSFYEASAEKIPKVDAEGFAVFQAEWARRRKAAGN